MAYGEMVEGVRCYVVWFKGNSVTCDREWCELMVYDI